MKKFWLIAACLVASLILSAPALMAKEFKLGIFDIHKIVRESRAGKNAMATLTKDLEAKRTILVEKQRELQALRADFDKAAAADRGSKQEKLAEAAKEYNRLAADLDEEHKKKTREINEKVLLDLREVITNVAKREGYTLILQKGSVYLSDDEYDMTDKIIRAYDQRR